MAFRKNDLVKMALKRYFKYGNKNVHMTHLLFSLSIKIKNFKNSREKCTQKKYSKKREIIKRKRKNFTVFVALEYQN